MSALLGISFVIVCCQQSRPHAEISAYDDVHVTHVRTTPCSTQRWNILNDWATWRQVIAAAYVMHEEYESIKKKHGHTSHKLRIITFQTLLWKYWLRFIWYEKTLTDRSKSDTQTRVYARPGLCGPYEWTCKEYLANSVSKCLLNALNDFYLKPPLITVFVIVLKPKVIMKLKSP